mgnify:CR=1 FL=1
MRDPQGAEALEPAETRMLALDFWMGNRTPYRDARLRGGDGGGAWRLAPPMWCWIWTGRA